jgi:hypothetical protein
LKRECGHSTPRERADGVTSGCERIGILAITEASKNVGTRPTVWERGEAFGIEFDPYLVPWPNKAKEIVIRPEQGRDIAKAGQHPGHSCKWCGVDIVIIIK